MMPCEDPAPRTATPIDPLLANTVRRDHGSARSPTRLTERRPLAVVAVLALLCAVGFVAARSGRGEAVSHETYRDEFDTVALDGSDGSVDWTTSPWIEQGESDGAAAGLARVVASVNCPSGNCISIAGNATDLTGRGWARPVDLAAATTATWTFVVATKSPSTTLLAQVSDDGGSGWTTVGTSTGGGLKSYDITAHADTDTWIRVVASGTPVSTDAWYVDDVEVDYTLVTNTVAGRVLEDVDGDGGLADGVAATGVDVWLFIDSDGDGEPSGGDVIADTTVTDGAGAFALSASGGDGTYWLAIDGRDVAPSAGYTSGSSLDDVFAEQTVGPAGAATFDGSSWTFAGAAGPVFGGARPTGTDGFPTLSAAEHVTRVVVSGADVTGLDHGFSFVPITTTSDENLPTGFDDTAAWDAYDAGANGVGTAPDGYQGAAFDGRYLYFAPDIGAGGAHGEVLRYDTTATFSDAAAWATYDPGANGVGTDPDGYQGALFDGRYVYFAPQYNGTANHGEVLRYDTTGAFTSAGSWTTYTPGPAGYLGMEFDGRYVYFAPFSSTGNPDVLRYDTTGTFTSAASWTTFDPVTAGIGTNPQGYLDVVFDARYLYFVPYYGGGVHHAEVLRYDTTAAFTAPASWTSFDPGDHAVGTDPDGFVGGVFDGRFIYFTPYYNGSQIHGEVLRLDTAGTFADPASWATYDPGDAGVGTDPDGYEAAAFDGRFVYFAPGFSGSGYHGEVLRYDTAGAFASTSSWTTFDPGENGVGADADGYRGIVTDGRHVYFVPAHNGTEPHGEVLRYDTQRAGQGSLRRFMQNSDAVVGTQTTNFELPTSDPGYVAAGHSHWSIQPVANLPVLREPVIIDGYTQVGAVAGTTIFPDPPDMHLVVEVSGALVPGASHDPINLTGGSSVVRGMVVNDWTGTGAVSVASTGSAGNTIQGNIIGLDASGTVAKTARYGIFATTDTQIGGSGPGQGNLVAGTTNFPLYLSGPGSVVEGNHVGVDITAQALAGSSVYGVFVGGAATTTIGGTDPGAGNLIAGAAQAGIYLNQAAGATIQGNIIGTDRTGAFDLGNGEGVWTNSSGTIVALLGGTDAGAGNVIANSTDDGVAVRSDDATVAIVGNSIHGSGGLAIDIEDDDVTLNDAEDGDGGPNDTLNFPVLARPTIAATTLDIDLDVPAGDYRIEVFSNAAGGSTSGHGEGQTFLHGETVTATGAVGDESFTLTGLPAFALDTVYSATATEDLGAGSFGATSEFSAWVRTCSDADADGLNDCAEDADTDADGDPSTNPGPDTDGDSTANYLDDDDDGDGQDTILEDADPNGDTDPRDALDADRDGEPDYLDPPALTTATTIATITKHSDTTSVHVSTIDDDDLLGASLASLGDLDGDGVVDLVAGLPGDDQGGSNRGGVFVLFMNADGTAHDSQRITDAEGDLVAPLVNGDEFGHAVANAGDLDGDGRNELVVTSANRGASGSAFVLFLGADGQVDAEVEIADGLGGFTAGIDVERFGSSAAGIGDLDGDGIPDLAIGDDHSDDGGTDHGAVHVLFMNADGTVRASQAISDTQGGIAHTWNGAEEFGSSVAAIGDLDGDGITELAVGSHRAADGAGTANGAVSILFMDTDGTVDSEQRLSDTVGGLTNPPASNSGFGRSVTGVGDLDGDGIPDLAVGANLDDDPTTDEGSVRLVLLSGKGMARADTVIGESGAMSGRLDASDAFGESVASVGDLDGDGSIGIAIGAPFDDDGGSDRGAVYVLDLDLSVTAVVNSTDDDADANAGDGICDTGQTNSEGATECTLRAAIQETNAHAAIDTIEFAIPTSDAGHSGGTWTIAPASDLDSLWSTMTIDGTSQPGWTSDPVIGLDGSSAAADGLLAVTAGVTIRGLAIHGWPSDGIGTGSSSGTFVRNWFGIDVAGTADANGDADLLVWGSPSGVTIGGPAGDGNRFAAAGTSDGVLLASSADGTVIEGNVFGMAPDGSGYGAPGEAVVVTNTTSNTTIRDNRFGRTPAAAVAHTTSGANTTLVGNVFGVAEDGTEIPFGQALYSNGSGSITFGGTGAGDGNVVIGASWDAMALVGGGDVTVLGNEFRSNGGLAIDLEDDDETLNDPGDGDSGTSDLLNFPEFTTPGAGEDEVRIDLDVPAGDYRIEVFSNPTDGADGSGYGEGERLLHAETVTHTGSGSESFVLTGVPTLASGDVLTATTTEDLGGGSYRATSEFSRAVTVADATAVTDRSRARHDLVAQGGLDVSSPGAGIVHDGVAVNGGAQRLGGPAGQSDAAALSLSGWLNATTLTADSVVVAQSAPGTGILFQLTADGAAGEAVVSLRVGGSTIEARGGSVATGTWHQLVATYDGADLILYVNGAEVDRTAVVGTITNDVTIPVTIGNVATGASPVDGNVDHVTVAGVVRSPEWITTAYLNLSDPDGMTAIGAEQTAAVGSWTTTSGVTRSGSHALAAPAATGGASPWAVLTGLDEPGLAFESWWYLTSPATSGVAAGTNTGLVPTDQRETLADGSGLDLAAIDGGTRTVDATDPATLAASTWTRVELRTDETGTSSVWIDGVRIIAPTLHATGASGGSAGLRVDTLPGGEAWYVDDVRVRRLVSDEPTATVRPLHRS